MSLVTELAYRSSPPSGGLVHYIRLNSSTVDLLQLQPNGLLIMSLIIRLTVDVRDKS